jgi:hypothetical protein
MVASGKAMIDRTRQRGWPTTHFGLLLESPSTIQEEPTHGAALLTYAARRSTHVKGLLEEGQIFLHDLQDVHQAS